MSFSFLIRACLAAFLACATPLLDAQPINPDFFDDATAAERRTTRTAAPAPWQVDDLGVLELTEFVEPPRTLLLSTTQALYYNDNVLFRPANEIGSAVWEGVFALRLVPYSTRRWTPAIEIDQMLVRHDRVAAFDYDGQSVTFTSRLHVTDALAWNVSYSLHRYYAARGSRAEIYKYGSPQTDLTWFHALSSKHRLGVIGSYQLAWRHSTPAFLDRLDNSVFLGLAYSPVDRVSVQPFVVPSLRYYPNDPAGQGMDFNVRAGLAVGWSPLEQVHFNVSFSWWRNRSDAPQREYDALVPRAGLALNLGF
jgi:hypothetical protein